MYFIKSIRDLDTYIDNLRKKSTITQNFEIVFRGQTNENWLLYPQISRSYFKNITSKRFENKLLYDFYKLIKRYKLNNFIQYNKINSWGSYQEMQHLGIPTRLMDWSINYHLALFFSVENPKYDDINGVIWIFKLNENYFFGENKKHLYINKKPFNIKISMLINPAIEYTTRYNEFIGIRRRLIQNGRFLIQPTNLLSTPLENNELFYPFLNKLIIPASFKKHIRKELEGIEIIRENIYCIKKENSINTKLFNLINKKIKSKYGFTKKSCRFLRRQL